MSFEISVVTPSYNSARFLDTCMGGVAVQDLPTEHLIVDNCSGDGTLGVFNKMREILCSKINPDYVPILVSGPDKGHHEAITKGILRASAPTVAVCNASDYYLFQSWFGIARAYLKNADCVWGMTAVVNGDDKDRFSHVGATKGLATAYRPYTLKDYLQREIGFTECTAVFRTEALKKLVPMSAEPHPWIDLQFEFYKAGFTSLFLPIVVAVTRGHEDSLTSKGGIVMEEEAFKRAARRRDELKALSKVEAV